MAYSIILTVAGKTKVAAAIASNTPIKLTQIAFGDGNGVEITPNQNATALAREVYRTDILSLTKHPSDTSVVIAECIIPVSAGGFWVREIGIYDETNALIAIGNYPAYYKEDASSGAASELKVNVMLKVNGANTELKIDSSLIFATKAYVDNIKEGLDKQMEDLSKTVLKSVQTSLAAMSITIAEKQDEILIFRTPAEYAAAIAANEIDEDTLFIKLYN